ncbi:SLC13 family permease [Natrarchaeobius chitinivorans]|uniref:SLC13 family permease n=1 Tax=Natrarchaeobius chitinivorans TaxID=1679083 RepID=A0A3N6LYW9_NATCH|nr:SLC13 family permease [Natrarchaeobius chitinivorans]RQG96063.1 SLC13 family permease [Natrarchaeobius chitinivorans]
MIGTFGTDLSTGAIVVFALIAVALALFVTEAISTDVTAIGIIVSLAALEPLTGVGHRTAISGFASTATITIVAMYMLSAGIQRTGLVQRLGASLAKVTRGSERRALAATIATTGPIAGFINNTPVVAIFIPMISELAEKIGISPSKLLLPLSYAAILGGTLTLIGTSTNLLASEFAVELLGRSPLGMFEFAGLGLVILIVGLTYLMTVGRWLTPARVPVDADLVEEFDLEDYLTHVRVRSTSTPVGLTVRELEDRIEAKVRILQLRREADLRSTDEGRSGETVASESNPTGAPDRLLEYDGDVLDEPSTVTERDREDGPIEPELSSEAVQSLEPTTEETESVVSVDPDQQIREGDVLTVHGNLQAVNRFVGTHGLRQLVRNPVTEDTFDESAGNDLLAKVVVSTESAFVGDRIADTHLRKIYRTTVLAVRREGELLRTDLANLRLQPGDLLLVQTVPEAIEYFAGTNDLIVVDEDAFDRLLEQDVDEVAPLSPKTPLTIAIMAGVVGTAALGLVSIVIAALAGVFAMIVTGCLSTSDAYDAVSWNVIFLLAGVIPLGIALEETGGSQFIASSLVATGDVLPLVLVLLLFYIVTGLLANVITPVATIVLMIPIAVDAASRLGVSEFSFLIAVMFASATSFMTPVGYQTNLMVYGPGGYEFTDFLKVGAPLQFLLALVTTAGIVLIWGL